jgi:protein-L-isoaspartate(D-aspartate) O-methyltransferase
LSDGSLGYPECAPYDRICITAACREVPVPLLEQLTSGGKLIAPIEEQGVQNLTLLSKSECGMSRRVICEVLYIPLRGQYGHVPPMPAD